MNGKMFFVQKTKKYCFVTILNIICKRNIFKIDSVPSERLALNRSPRIMYNLLSFIIHLGFLIYTFLYSKTVAELKLRFPSLQESIRAVLTKEMDRAVTEEK